MTKPVWVTAAFIAGLLALTAIEPQVGRPLAFVFACTSGGLWLLGFTRTPRHVRDARRAAKARGPLPAIEHAEVAEQEFVYPRKKGAQIVLWSMSFLLTAVFGTLAIGAESVAPIVWVFPALSAVGPGVMAFRITRYRVRVGPRGIESNQFFGTTRMRWEEIVAISDSVYFDKYGNRATAQIFVYSATDRLMIGEKLVRYTELIAILEANAPPLPPAAA